MLVDDPDGHRGVFAQDVFISLWLGRNQTPDILLAPGEIDHRSVAEDQTECEQSPGAAP